MYLIQKILQEFAYMENVELDYVSIIQSCMCTNLRLVSRAITKLYDTFLESINLKSTQFTMLVAIAYKKKVTVSELANMLVMDITTTSRSIKILEDQKLLTLTYSKKDRRNKFIEITSQGRNKIIESYPHWNKAQEFIEENFSNEKMNDLLTLISSLVESVKKVI